MMSTSLAMIPIALQAAAMFVDEGIFHRRRGLPRWERIGHPLDTATVAACYAFLVFVTPKAGALGVYVVLAAFSCLFVTKDEVVHARHCTAAEHWLHSVLFVLHPTVLALAGALWWNDSMHRAITFQFAVTLIFGAYQIIYWNGPWRRIRHANDHA